MSHRVLAFVGPFAIAIGLVMPGPAAGQESGAQAETWTLPQTPWGEPDLQGIWDFRTLTPLERPDELAGKAALTDEEAAAYQAERVARLDKDRRTEDGLTAEADVALAYNEFWWDYGKTLTEDKRTSLIVDPLDGRIPPLTPEAQARVDLRREAGQRPAHGPEDRSVSERCILGFNAGPPVNPSAYNNNIQIFQIPGQVVILVEMVHDVRVVPLDGRPHLPGHIRQWKGDSRGHWEGETLVVETTNFTDKTSFRGSGPALHLTERFTRADADTLLYEYSIDDPQSFTVPWSAVIPMQKTEAPMFEYACHEGNYGMANLLAGARAQEKAATKTESR